MSEITDEAYTEAMDEIARLKAIVAQLTNALQAHYPSGWVHITSDATLIEKAKNL
jgi:hypothetical protein